MNLESSRLLLRPWEETDAEACYRWASDPEVGPACGWEPHKSVANSLEIIRTILRQPDTFAVTVKENGPEAVGSLGAFPCPAVPGETEIGYWLARPFWGKGYMPEAVLTLLEYLFVERNEKRVWVSHAIGNDKSRRVTEKCGFRGEFYKDWKTAWGERRICRYCSIRWEEYASKFGDRL